MALPFLDRKRELARLRRAIAGRTSTFSVIYGRRRLGKSRLLQELLPHKKAVYYVADERDSPLQRGGLALEMARLLPRFGDVTYPDWNKLFERWWAEAPSGAVLVLDEFPYVAQASPELPSILQKFVDRPARKPRHLLVAGSSQRMMHGLVLDASAPLYGRTDEQLRLEPLGAGWIRDAFRIRNAVEAVNHYATWGGVPRYWELAAQQRNRRSALQTLVLDPLGVLHHEPERLLLDELEQIAKPASLLALIGQGAHRLSEIAGRLGAPATSLSRPLARLVDLGFVTRDLPFGQSSRDTKRTYYRITDPFLRFWYRFVEPNRSRLAAGQIGVVGHEVERRWSSFLGGVWEDLARASVPRLARGGRRWSPAARWWGSGIDGKPMELDIVAESIDDPKDLLIGEAKLELSPAELRGAFAKLQSKIDRCPIAHGKRVTARIWLLGGSDRQARGVIGASTVLDVLR
jgi:AAA+ ATPase superfamily predicted ATPase